MKLPGKLFKKKAEKTKTKKGDTVNAGASLKRSTKRIILTIVWLGAFSPLFVILLGLYIASDDIPSHEELANPPDKQASIIYSSDGVEMEDFGVSTEKVLITTRFRPMLLMRSLQQKTSDTMSMQGLILEELRGL